MIGQQMGDPMKSRFKFMSFLILSILIMTACMNLFLTLPQTEAGNFDGTNTRADEMIIDFPGTGETTFLIPSDSNVTKASVNFTTIADDNGKYPENIELKFGEVLPIDWAFQGGGHGGYGFQQYFTDSQVRVNLTYDEDGYNDTLSFLVPQGADVSQASLKLTAFNFQ